MNKHLYSCHPLVLSSPRLQEYLHIHKSCECPVKVNPFTSHPAIWLQEYSHIHKSCVCPVKVNPFTSHPAIWLQEYSHIHKSCVCPVKVNPFTSHPAIWLQEYSHIHKSCVCPVKINPITSHPAIWLQEYSHIHNKSCVCPVKVNPVTLKPARWLREYVLCRKLVASQVSNRLNYHRIHNGILTECVSEFLLWIANVRRCLYKCRPLDPILSEIKSTELQSKINLNSIIPLRHCYITRAVFVNDILTQHLCLFVQNTNMSLKCITHLYIQWHFNIISDDLLKNTTSVIEYVFYVRLIFIFQHCILHRTSSIWSIKTGTGMHLGIAGRHQAISALCLVRRFHPFIGHEGP